MENVKENFHPVIYEYGKEVNKLSTPLMSLQPNFGNPRNKSLSALFFNESLWH